MEDPLFAGRAFDLLDADGSGTIEWEEYLTALSALERGGRELRAEFIFKSYDTEGTGNISEENLHEFFLSSLHQEKDKLSKEAAAILKDFSTRVFKSLDVEGKGTVKLQDAISQLKNLQHADDVSAVFGRSMVLGSQADPLTLVKAATAAAAKLAKERAAQAAATAAAAHAAAEAAAKLLASNGSGAGGAGGAGADDEGEEEVDGAE